MGLDDARNQRMARSTAEGAATLRAVGALLSDPLLRGPDYLAARFISPGGRAAALVKVPLLRRVAPALVERMLPGGLAFELGRTKYMDEVLAAEVAAGAEQVIMLGAGLDSRPYRMRDQLADSAIFEVDHPITAAFKRERLEAVLGRVPDHVTYVQIDFNKEDLAQVLAASGYDPTRRSVVIWSGVAPYLEPAGVSATLRWMAAQAPGSILVFDYCWQEYVDGELDHMPGATILRKRVEAQGEPLLWGIPRGGAAECMADHGLELVEELGAEEGTRRYLTASDGSTLEMLWDFGGMIRARVPERA
jgi:methyltransferase (TIGR00027 family)